MRRSYGHLKLKKEMNKKINKYRILSLAMLTAAAADEEAASASAQKSESANSTDLSLRGIK